MTTSGVTTFSMTRDTIISAAHRKLAVLGDGDIPTTSQITNASEALNNVLKLFQTKGMPLWGISDTSLTMTATNTYTYGIGQSINIPAPLKIISARIIENTSGNTVPLNLVTRDEYNRLSTTLQTGRPISFWYEPLNQIGVLHLWPIPDATTIASYTIKFVQQRPVEDMVSASNTLDFPQWWADAVIYALAVRLAPEFSIPLQDRGMLAKEADYYLGEALSFGTEEGSLFFSPQWR